MAKIQEDSYWWKDDSLPEKQQCMHGLCIECYAEKGVGWYWPGKKTGYGDYDLRCHFCNKPIHIRDNTKEIND